MKNRALGFCTTLASSALWLAVDALAQQNNVLILVADDLGVDSVAAYQEGVSPPTPNLDALAARGALFRNAWSHPLCSSTRAGIMTGRYGFRTGVGAHLPGFPGLPPTGELRLEEITLPELLDKAGSGYAHAAIGKWHLGRVAGDLTPNAAGWSHFAGLVDGAADYFSWPRTVNGITATSPTYVTTQIVDDALAWISDQSGPWLCYVAFTAPHTPFHAPPAALHTRNLSGAGSPIANPRPYYEAMVEAMDTEIGRLLGALGPELSRTNVIFVGDNGTHPAVILPPFNRSRGKGMPYEGGINVPLLVAGPDVVSPGREVASLVSTVDLFATTAELTDVDPAAVVPAWVTLDSVSFAADLNGAQANPRTTLFSELYFGNSYAQVTQNGFGTMRNSRFKLIRMYSRIFGSGGSNFPQDELYDLFEDPWEAYDLLRWPLTPLRQQNYDALAQQLARLMSVDSRFDVFGAAGCAGSNGNPVISGTGSPEIGTTYQVELSSAAHSSVALLATGLSYTKWRPGAGWFASGSNSRSVNPLPEHGGEPYALGGEQLALPANLALFGAGPNCWLYTAPDMLLAVPTSDDGFASVQVRVPASRAFVGRTLFHSWFVVDLAAPGNLLGVTVSNGAAVVAGIGQPSLGASGDKR